MNVNIIIGYIIVINIIGFLLILISARTDYIKLKEKTLNLIYIIIAILGGFVGLLVASEMLGYRTKDKIFKKIIPFIIFVEFSILLYLYWKANN